MELARPICQLASELNLVTERLTGSAVLGAYWVLHLPQDCVTIIIFKTIEILIGYLNIIFWFVLVLHESSWHSWASLVFDLFMPGWGRRGSSSSRCCRSSSSAKIRALSLCVLLLALENLSCWWFGCWEMNGALPDFVLVFMGGKVEIVDSAGLVSLCVELWKVLLPSAVWNSARCWCP